MSCISASGKLHTSCYFNQEKSDKRTHRILTALKVQVEAMWKKEKKKAQKPQQNRTFRVATEDDDHLGQLLFMKERKSPLFHVRLPVKFVV